MKLAKEMSRQNLCKTGIKKHDFIKLRYKTILKKKYMYIH